MSKLGIFKRILFVGILIFGLLWILINRYFEVLTESQSHLLSGTIHKTDGGEYEVCEVANLNLSEIRFLDELNKDNERRAYKPKCLPSSWQLFDFDYDSNLVRVEQKQPIPWNNISCCYIPFQRQEDSDTGIILSKKCHKINQDKMRLPAEHEFINVQCTEKKEGKNNLIYSDLLGFVPTKPDVEKRILDYEKKMGGVTSEHKRVNIVIFGLDAVSKYNFLRYLPETHKYIVGNISGIEFTKYHRTDGFSFDNMVGFHMGMTRKETEKMCWPNKDAYLDTCPLIWKEFAAKGFRTSYAEDAVPWSIFWYDGDCKGFVKQPTDYDLRTLTRRMEYHPGYLGEPTSKVCYGSKFNHQVIIDNIIRTAVTLKDKLYFQFSWICAMTHNVSVMTKYIGDSIIKMFQDLQKIDAMDNTVFIFTADHGMNFGFPAKMIQGSLEANFPLFYMIFPKWFSLKYPRAMKNLERNSKLLTSHFDTYETLKDFLDLSTIADEALAEREKNISYISKRGISFFLPIPKRRNCQTAGLMSKYCSCWTLQTVPNNHFLVNESKEFLIKYLQNGLSNNPGCVNAIRSGQVEKSKCNIPSQDLASRISVRDYQTLGIEPRCELHFKITSNSKTVISSLKKSGGVWTLKDIYFSGKQNENSEFCNLKSSLNNFCDCFL